MIQPPIRVGEVELEIAEVPGEPFGRVGGLAVRSDGGVCVVDRQAGMVHLVGTDGRLSATFGRPGRGPGDLEQPCCPRLTADGRLWLRSRRPERLDVFHLEGTSFRFERRILLDRDLAFALRPPVVLSNGQRIIMQAGHRSDGRVAGETVAVELDARGRLVRQWPYPSRDGDAAVAMEVVATIPRRQGRIRRITMQVPYGPSHGLKHRGDGWYVRCRTDSYHVTMHRLDGKVVRRISRADLEGPELTAEERKSGEAFLAKWSKPVVMAGGSVSNVSLPLRKPPIDDFWFDSDNRLWIELSAHARDDFTRADVYDVQGGLAFRASWPRGKELRPWPYASAGTIDLRHGAGTDSIAWGVKTGPLDEDRLVLVRFRQGARGL